MPAGAIISLISAVASGLGMAKDIGDSIGSSALGNFVDKVKEKLHLSLEQADNVTDEIKTTISLARANMTAQDKMSMIMRDPEMLDGVLKNIDNMRKIRNEIQHTKTYNITPRLL